MEEKQKNKDFIQLYREVIGSVVELAKKNIRAFELFMIVVKNMDGYNALCISNAVLCELMQCSKSTVIRATKFLKKEGWIDIYKTGNSNVYVINPDVVWTSYANQKAYCKFPANIMLTSTQNDNYLDNPKAVNYYKQIDNNYVQAYGKKRKELKQIGESANVDL